MLGFAFLSFTIVEVTTVVANCAVNEELSWEGARLARTYLCRQEDIRFCYVAN
jgi:hypothetical protein